MDVWIHTVLSLKQNKTNFFLLDKKKKICQLTKVFSSFYKRIEHKEKAVENCNDLQYEILKDYESTSDYWSTGVFYKNHGMISKESH